MKSLVKAVSAALVVGLIFVGLFAWWRKQTQPVEGIKQIEAMDTMETAGIPKFSGHDLDGQLFQLDEVKNQVVIVNFWATWCGPCVEEMPSLISLVEAMKGQVRLVAVSADESREDIDAFMKSFPKMKNPNITIIWDDDRSISRKYNVDRFPESFIAGKDLKLAKKIIGGIAWHSDDSIAYMTELFNRK